MEFSNDSPSGNSTLASEPIVADSSSSPPLEGSLFTMEELEIFFNNEPISPEIDATVLDPEGDIRLLEEMLNNELSLPLSPKDINLNEIKNVKPSEKLGSGSTTSRIDSLLEEFADELAHDEKFTEYESKRLEFLLNSEPSECDSEEFTNELAHNNPFPSDNDDNLFDFHASREDVKNLLYHAPPIDPYTEPNDSESDDDLFDFGADQTEWRELLYGKPSKDKFIKEKELKLETVIEEVTIDQNELSPLSPEGDFFLSHESSIEYPVELSCEDKVFKPGIPVDGENNLLMKSTLDKDLKFPAPSKELLILEKRNLFREDINDDDFIN